MPDYFAEHNCEPLAEGQSPNHVLHFARFVNTLSVLAWTVYGVHPTTPVKQKMCRRVDTTASTPICSR